ncbi:MAG: Fe-S protein assembly co-chaperone HscB [Gammaproteobacteria bacterium]|jgi:molecular chaperone HscB
MAVDLSSTHFELFGLAPEFRIDREQLDSRFRELQRAAHPDRFASATDQERRLSMQQAAHINEGYQTLKDPLKRGRYLLELGGYRFTDEQHTTADAAFLMEQMELREALGEVRASADPLGRLGAIMARIDGAFCKLADELPACLEAGDAPHQDKAAEILLKMQFYRRLDEEARDLEAAIEDQPG